LLSNPERITIDIQYQDFMKLAHQREIALARGYLDSDNNDYVPARIRYEDESMDAKLRLKGDFLDHLNTAKWSFRVELKGESYLFGMRLFSVQHPKTRSYINEWIYHQALKREGIIALRYEFVNVTLNGKDMGIYALEEHFEKRLIEHNDYREGPIVRFGEELLFLERFQQSYPFSGAQTNGNLSYFAASIDTFQTSQMFTDPAIFAQHVKAMQLLESFRRGILETSDVFDIEKLAKFFALNDLLGAQHSTNWSNLRFYYNPITSRLEPIGFDGDAGQSIKTISIGIGPEVGINHIETIFSDPLFLEEYVRTLERISESSYLDELFEEINGQLERNLRILYREFPYKDFSTGVYYRNSDYIKTVLDPIKGLHAHFHQPFGGGVQLELGNIQALPVEVLGVSYLDNFYFKPIEKIILPESSVLEAKPIDYQIAGFGFPEDFEWSDSMRKDLWVNYRLLGASQIRQESVYPWSYLSENFVDSDFIRQSPNIRQFEFLVVDESAGEILIKPGVWNLDRYLIIPKGYRVIGGPGTTLNLSNAAKVLSYSALEWIGSEENPIVIQSLDLSGEGVVVMGADHLSTLEHVVFRNLSSPKQGSWGLTGAVTFYESPVRMFQSRFINSGSEDALNVVRSAFTLDGIHFGDSFGDALDIDFSEGRILNSSFIKSGNDAIDVSGSIVEIQGVIVDGSSDKGVSVGEMSNLSVNGIRISNSNVAVASKDLSNVVMENLSISNCEYGLTAFNKKPEYGSASIVVDGLEMTEVNTPYFVERESIVIVDNTQIAGNQENVKEILYDLE
jgi:hypothetical protein